MRNVDAGNSFDETVADVLDYLERGEKFDMGPLRTRRALYLTQDLQSYFAVEL